MLAAATRLFAREGYSASTIRAIAVEAGVDSALVIQFFGSKELLFTAVLDSLKTHLPTLLSAAEQTDPSSRGRLLATTYFSLWESPETGPAAQALIRGAIGSPGATEIMQRFLETSIFAVAPRTELATVSAMLLGLATARYVIRVGPLAAMSIEQLVDLVAPSLQLIFDR